MNSCRYHRHIAPLSCRAQLLSVTQHVFTIHIALNSNIRMVDRTMVQKETQICSHTFHIQHVDCCCDGIRYCWNPPKTPSAARSETSNKILISHCIFLVSICFMKQRMRARRERRREWLNINFVCLYASKAQLSTRCTAEKKTFKIKLIYLHPSFRFALYTIHLRYSFFSSR